MSSGSNYSVSELRKISIARQDFFSQLYDKRFGSQEDQQHLGQSGVLTVEQQDIIERVSAVCYAYEETLIQMQVLDSLFDAYDVNQIIAEMDEIGEMTQYLERQLKELGGIDDTDIQ